MPARINVDSARIVKLYKSGLTSIQIAGKFGVSKPTILKRLRENKVAMRPNAYERKYNFNDLSFAKFTKESCYWAGFIAADGWISNGLIGVELSIKDDEHLKKLCNFIDREPKLWYRERNMFGKIRKYCQMGIRSKIMIRDLENNFNIVPRKSLILKPPYNVPDELTHHYIRGYFDGDGCLDCNGFSLRFTVISGSKIFLEWIKSEMKSALDIGNPNILQRKDTAAFSLSFSGNKQVPKIRDWLYKDCAQNFLTRKK